MPQLDIATYPQQLVWLLISFVVLYLLVWRVALPRILRVVQGRQERIDGDLREAERLRDEAEETQAALESARAEALADSQARHRETMQGIAAERARRQEELSARIGAEAAEAERRIATETEIASREIPEIAVAVVKSVTEQLTGAAATDAEARAAVAAITGAEPG